MNVEDYYSAVPEKRRARIEAIRDCFLAAVRGVSETMRYKMPAFAKGDNWVSLANQKNYISIYFCDETSVAMIRRKHPELDIGKGCVRVRDNQPVPLDELRHAFVKALGS